MEEIRPTTVLDLIRRLDEAVEAPDDATACRRAEVALQAALESGAELVPAAWRAPLADHYARRALHLDLEGRYSVVCMTWGPGQGTPLHDHGDSWGAVGVVEGTIRVTPYECVGRSGEDWSFRSGEPIDAPRGALSSVVPPGDFHTIENPFEATAVSIHVYKGRMPTAGIYLPGGDAYRRVVKRLAYDPS